MASSPQRRAANYRIDGEVISAARTIFGALELISETPCSESTERDVQVAMQGAEGCLAELGLSRDDLLETDCTSLHLIDPPLCPVVIYPRVQGEIVPLRARRAGPRQ